VRSLEDSLTDSWVGLRETEGHRKSQAINYFFVFIGSDE